ncbi:MAG: T9SS type A sorting domain-containing protein [Bacteroidota bacterium]
MKFGYFFLLALLLSLAASMCIAQSDSLVDVFPLSVGNSWKYSFSDEFTDMMSLQKDTGVVIFTVVESHNRNDTTDWIITEHRVYVDSMWGTVRDPETRNIDTSFVRILTEVAFGNHQLYSYSNEFYGVHDFLAVLYPSLPESSKIYRYQQVDSSRKITINYRANILNYYSYRSVLMKDTGLTSINIEIAWYEDGGENIALHLQSSIINGVHENYTPRSFSLLQNYPNPFNPRTTISFSLPEEAFVTLRIFNILGQQVATLVNEKRPPGEYSEIWNAGYNSSGIYFYELTNAERTKIGKMVLMK